MPGKARPSLRAKVLYNVEHSSLNKTDKECIKAVFAMVEDDAKMHWNNKAHWIKDNNKRTCSRCGWYYFSNGVDSNYCSECGARMNGKEEIKCIDCKHRMFSDMYCECSKGYKGIVQPWDGCEHGEKIEE